MGMQSMVSGGPDLMKGQMLRIRGEGRKVKRREGIMERNEDGVVELISVDAWSASIGNFEFWGRCLGLSEWWLTKENTEVEETCTHHKGKFAMQTMELLISDLSASLISP